MLVSPARVCHRTCGEPAGLAQGGKVVLLPIDTIEVKREGALVPEILYLSRTGMLEPLGQSQVLSYLKGLSRSYRITLVSYESAPTIWLMLTCCRKSNSFAGSMALTGSGGATGTNRGSLQRCGTLPNCS